MTRFAYVIGSPIRHSLSPAIHNAALSARGIDARYEAVEVLPEHLAEWVRTIRSPATLGFNVTLPHKVAVRAELDEVEGDAILAGAVNAVVAIPSRETTRLVGTNTDTVGFRRLLADEAGISLSGQRVLLLGAGGGARAVALVALQDGADRLWVANRHVDHAEALLADLSGVANRTEVQALALDDAQTSSALRSATVVVNASSVGLRPGETPLGLAGLSPESIAVDLIYNPATTTFLHDARQLGAQAVNGLGMLVFQAAAAFERWTGTEAPIEIMRTAATQALAARSS